MIPVQAIKSGVNSIEKAKVAPEIELECKSKIDEVKHLA